MARQELDSSGGLISSIPGFTITEAVWATSPNYNSGQTWLLCLFGKDGQGNTYEADGFYPSYPAPEGWISLDGGASIQHPEKTVPNTNSLLGRFWEKVKALVPETLNPDPLDGKRIQDASTFVGLTFDFEVETIDWGKNIKPSERLMPVRFVSAGGGAAAPAAAPAAAAGGGDLEAALKALAASMPSHQAFQSAAMAMPDVLANPLIMQQVVDQQNGIWAQVKG